AEDDSATGGPDLARRIYPVVWTASADGAEQVAEDRVAELVDQIVTGRRTRPDGPGAPVV
ncbi:MAG: proteasome subunit beta, partial [Microlunatus sp.]|nr:proteasome subunit beta [Microlunatus sp.]